MSTTKVLIVDDHWVVVEGVKRAIESYEEFEIVGEAEDGFQAIELTASLKPDIVIMDITMPNLNGLEATYKIKKSYPEIHIIIFTMYSDEEYVMDLYKAGISAYVLKDNPLLDLILALKVVNRNGTYFNQVVSDILLDHILRLEEKIIEEDPYDSLSQREREIFQNLAEGKSVKKIAKELYISPKTVESHKYHIMEKLQTNSMIELTKIAIRKNLINITTSSRLY